MMRMVTALFVGFGILCAGLAPLSSQAGSDSAAVGFFSGIEDFPIMPGLSELPDATLIFDSPSGRFVEAYAFGQITSIDLESFYSSTLPQLGWEATGASTYQREGELLEITIIGPVADDGTQTVRFAISPSGGGVNNN